MTNRAILLVEDNPDDEALTLRALKGNNILNTVTVAHDGAEALEHLFTDGSADVTRPGLILLDLKLPKVDGLEVLRRIRADERTQIHPRCRPHQLQRGRRRRRQLPRRRQRLSTKAGKASPTSPRRLAPSACSGCS